jgi:hypothetical protein
MLSRHHTHWAVADERLEMLDFERLHVMVELSEPISRAEGTRLVTLAQASGWAEMDGLIADEGVDAAQEMGAAPGPSAYLERVSQSLEVYREAFGLRSDTRLFVLEEICGRIEKAYKAGREERLAEAIVRRPGGP